MSRKEYKKQTISFKKLLQKISWVKWKWLFEKYKNHPSITVFTERMKNLGNSTFSFYFISHDAFVKELKGTLMQIWKSPYMFAFL